MGHNPILDTKTLGLIFGFILAGVLLISSSWLQSKIYPVVSDVEITHIEPTNDGKALIWVTFRKNYDCDFIGLSWYAGQRDGVFTKVATYFLPESSRDDSDQSRPPGTQSAGPWSVDIPPDHIENSFADVTHKCLLPVRSRTPFYN